MNCTLQDWATIYSRELAENPSVDDLAQLYFMANKWWEPPTGAHHDAADAGPAVLWDCPFPATTE